MGGDRVGGGGGFLASAGLIRACAASALNAQLALPRARAVIDGRYAPSLDDVAELAEPVLQHRMALTFAARADGVTIDDVIDDVVADLGGPRSAETG